MFCRLFTCQQLFLFAIETQFNWTIHIKTSNELSIESVERGNWASEQVESVCSYKDLKVFLSAGKMSAVLVFLTLLSVLVVTAYLYVNYAYSYWKRRGVPYIQPKFPFGNFKKMFFKERSLPEMLRVGILVLEHVQLLLNIFPVATFTWYAYLI